MELFMIFGILGFVFGLYALGLIGQMKGEITELRDQIEKLK